jgi:hypothetical protein
MMAKGFAILLLLLVRACGDKSATESGGQVFFEVEYVNYAHGYQHHGFYVDQGGGVHAYDFTGTGEIWRDSVARGFAASTLMKKFGHHDSLLTTIDADSLSQSHLLAKEAAQGTFSDTAKNVADRGTLAYYAYLYDPALGSYRRITLREDGDWSFRNQSPAARALVDWLKRTVHPAASRESR